MLHRCRLTCCPHPPTLSAGEYTQQTQAQANAQTSVTAEVSLQISVSPKSTPPMGGEALLAGPAPLPPPPPRTPGRLLPHLPLPPPLPACHPLHPHRQALTVGKVVVGPVSVLPGDRVQYAITVTNVANVALDRVQLTDDVSFLAGTVAVEPAAGCTIGGTPKTLSCEFASLAAGGTVTLTLTGDAPSSPGAYTNTVLVKSDLNPQMTAAARIYALVRALHFGRPLLAAVPPASRRRGRGGGGGAQCPCAALAKGRWQACAREPHPAPPHHLAGQCRHQL